jgi:predicted RecB family nuclease
MLPPSKLEKAAMSTYITGAMLYDLIQCPHRVTMDLFGDLSKRDEPNPFVQLLWEKGGLYEKEVIAGLNIPFLDLSLYAGEEKERLTTEAMARGEPLIYGGKIKANDLLGNPDLLRKQETGYVAGDIKSGSGQEGDSGDDDDEGKPKKHYAVQIALYTDILEQKGLSAGRKPFIWDIHGKEVVYDLEAPQGVRNPASLWTVYQEALSQARLIASKLAKTLPAYSGVCKMCHWYSACISELKERDDLTLLPDLGRTKRDVMIGEIPTLAAFAKEDIKRFLTEKKKTVFKGIGPESLAKLHVRAQLVKQVDPKPFLTQPISLPFFDKEIFFDIETDPMRDICYLHGFVERNKGDNKSEKYIAFFMNDISEAEEEKAFKGAWQYLQDMQPCVIYYYSKYERTIWRKLQARYPNICSSEALEALFDPHRMIDLYFDVVKKFTEWPTRDHSIKTLAKYLGFGWRDIHPSGAASIEWFDRWIKTGDTTIKQRILDYNEDDCRATRVLLDGIRAI